MILFFFLEKRNQEILGLSKALFDQSVIYNVFYKETLIQQQYLIFQHVEEFFFFGQFGWKVARGYLQTCVCGWFRWYQASDPIVGLGNFLQFIHSLPSNLNLESWYPSWHWQPPLLVDSAEWRFAMCNPSYGDVCQFKDSVHVFLELLGHFEAWCLATLETRVHEWIQISRICFAAKRYLWKRDAGCIVLLIWKKTLAGVLNWAAYLSFSL